MKKSILALLLAVLMVASLLPAAAMAEDVTVEAGSGIETLWKEAKNGDTIVFPAGTYNIGNLTTDKLINIKGAGAGATTLIGTIVYNFAAPQTGNISISGITLVADTSTVQGIQFRAKEPMSESTLNINISNCAFDGWQYALTMNSHANGYNMTVSGCDFSDSLYAVSYSYDTKTTGQINKNTLVFGDNNVINPNGFAVQKFNNQRESSPDFSDKTYETVADYENDTPVSRRVKCVATVAKLKSAVENAEAGDVIAVAPGTYNVGDDYSFNITKKITIQGAGENTVIKGNGAANYGLGLFTFKAGSEGTVLKNFTINYTATGVQRAAIMFHYGFEGNNNVATKIQNLDIIGADKLSNDIKAIGISSVYFDGPGNVEISDCALTNFAYGMYFNSFNNLYIHDNVINGTKYNAINVAGDRDDYPSDNIRIVDNTLINISYSNNDYEEYSSGIRVGVNVTDVHVLGNNISMLNGKTPVYYDPDTSDNPVRFIVKYVSNGVVIELYAVDAANSTIPLYGAPYNPGYAFLGWNDGVTTYSELAQYTVTEDTTFTAVWVRHPDTEYVPEPEQPVEPETPVFPFYDVPTSAWYYTAVKYVYDNKLMDGVDTYVFAPNDTLTRAMVWTIIARMSGVDTTGGANWYAKAQEWVIMNGISDGENPTAAITREQLVTMLYRYAQIKGYDVSVGENTNILSYVDATSISEYAVAAFQWACGSGLTEGDENGALTPLATATRAQAAAMIMRFLSK